MPKKIAWLGDYGVPVLWGSMIPKPTEDTSGLVIPLARCQGVALDRTSSLAVLFGRLKVKWKGGIWRLRLSTMKDRG